MEETRLLFYRGLPFTLLRRLGQYCALYLAVLAPEIIVMGWLAPVHVRIQDALGFILAGFSLLLLMNSLLLVSPMGMKDFLKGCLVIFGLLYFSVLAGAVITLSGFLFIVAGSLFLWRYYSYDNHTGQII
jgi:hypothetical protein